MPSTSGSESSDDWEEPGPIECDLLKYTCLACESVYIHEDKFINHLSEHSEWNSLLQQEKHNMKDQYDWIRFVNYVRLEHPSDWCKVFEEPLWKQRSEKLLIPVVTDDAVLTIDVETLLEGHRDNCTTDRTSTILESEKGVDITYCDLNSVLQENARLREQYEQCMKLLHRVTSDSNMNTSDSTVIMNSHEYRRRHRRPIDEEDSDPDDSAYFVSYGQFGIHAEMINDRVRTESYRDFMLRNATTHIQHKRVLDVGTGSAVLSLFAAEAGASHVYGVEASSDIFPAAQETLRANGLQDRVTLIRSRAETVQLPVEKVDVIISEWMGYFLLLESMLDSVLQVAQRYLIKDGLILPRHYSLHLIGVHCGDQLRRDHLDLWNDVYGYQMPALRRAALAEAHVIDLTDPRIQSHPDNSDNPLSSFCTLTAKSCQIHSIDTSDLLRQIQTDSEGKLPDAQDVGTCQLVLQIDSALPPDTDWTLDALVGYFDVRFDDDAPFKVEFSTSPNAPRTHWKQTVFFLDCPLHVRPGDVISGSFLIRRSVNDVRGLDVRLHLDSVRDQAPIKQSYSLVL